MVALNHWVCYLFFWRGQLMFWSLFSLWYFGGTFVWVAFLFAGEWLMSPQFQRVHFPPLWPITDQFPWHQGFRASGAGSSWAVYGMQGCASNHQVRLQELSWHLWCPFVCGTKLAEYLRDGKGGLNGSDRLQCRIWQGKPSGDSLQALFCMSCRYGVICSEAVSL